VWWRAGQAKAENRDTRYFSAPHLARDTLVRSHVVDVLCVVALQYIYPGYRQGDAATSGIINGDPPVTSSSSDTDGSGGDHGGAGEHPSVLLNLENLTSP
jgi:hypothetical protein